MDLCLKTFSVVLLLFAAASCAPFNHSVQDACADVRNSSLELNTLAKEVLVKVSFCFEFRGFFLNQPTSREIKNTFGIFFKL